MPKYEVTIRGENFVVNGPSGKPEPLGFLQLVYIEAENPDQAELDAVDFVRRSDIRDQIQNLPEDPPMLYLHEMSELDSFEGIERPASSRMFYSDNDDDSESVRRTKYPSLTLGAAIAFWLIGGLLLCLSIFYFLRPMIGEAGAPPHEYGVGAMFSVIFSLAAFLGAAYLSNRVKAEISRRSHMVLAMPALVLGTIFFALYVVSILMPMFEG